MEANYPYTLLSLTLTPSCKIGKEIELEVTDSIEQMFSQFPRYRLYYENDATCRDILIGATATYMDDVDRIAKAISQTARPRLDFDWRMSIKYKDSDIGMFNAKLIKVFQDSISRKVPDGGVGASFSRSHLEFRGRLGYGIGECEKVSLPTIHAILCLLNRAHLFAVGDDLSSTVHNAVLEMVNDPKTWFEREDSGSHSSATNYCNSIALFTAFYLYAWARQRYFTPVFPYIGANLSSPAELAERAALSGAFSQLFVMFVQAYKLNRLCELSPLTMIRTNKQLTVADVFEFDKKGW